MIRECPEPNPDCPHYEQEPPRQLRGQEHGCYSDEDHIVPRRFAVDALSSAYIRARFNRQQLCRWQHDIKTAEGDEPLPSPEIMEEALILNDVHISRRVRKALDK